MDNTQTKKNIEVANKTFETATNVVFMVALFTILYVVIMHFASQAVDRDPLQEQSALIVTIVSFLFGCVYLGLGIWARMKRVKLPLIIAFILLVTDTAISLAFTEGSPQVVPIIFRVIFLVSIFKGFKAADIISANHFTSNDPEEI